MIKEKSIKKIILRIKKNTQYEIGFFESFSSSTAKDSITITLTNGTITIDYPQYDYLTKNDDKIGDERDEVLIILEDIVSTFKPKKSNSRIVRFFKESHNVSIIAVIVSIITFGFSTSTFYESYNQDKRKVALELSKDWIALTEDADFRKIIIDVRERSGDNLNETQKNDIQKEYNRLINHPSTQNDTIKYIGCIKWLNIYERIVLAYNHNIGDRKIINETFGNTIDKDIYHLRPFIRAYRNKDSSSTNTAWKVLEEKIVW